MLSRASSSILRHRWLLPLLAALALSSCREESKSGGAAAEAPRDAGPRLYVLGSSVHLRKAPSPEAESLEQLRIGMECVPLEPTQGEWRKVRCGDKEGYASAALLGSEKPSLEKLKAEAGDPQLKLAQRMDSAQRAATLAPEEASLSKQLGDLFFERHFELLAGLKQPLKGPKIESPCVVDKDVADCILESAGRLRAMKRRAVIKDPMFVAAFGDSEQVAVYRGRFRYARESQLLTVEVLERTRFSPTPVLDQALFEATEEDDLGADTGGPRLGEFVLDAPAQNLLGKLPLAWELLVRSEEGHQGIRINGCNQRSYVLQLSPDLHGRWLAVVDTPGAPFPDERWVTAASRTERGTKLTLSRSAEDTAPKVFEVPAEANALASLGQALYTHQTEKYPDHHEPCGSVEAGAGPAFSGEFLPGKAMAALYGRFDAAEGSSQWVPSHAERWRLQRFDAFDLPASGLLARPWKWETYREGEQEKLLFLTETRSFSVLIGGGIFSKTEDGWRLERANRVMTVLLPRAEFQDTLSVQAIGERGVVAVMTVGYTTSASSSYDELVVFSDVGGQESLDRVGTLPHLREDMAVCPWDRGKEGHRADADCYAYNSEWTFVPDPEHALPQIAVTSRGTRLREGKSQEVESFHDFRTFSFQSGEYTLSSRQDVPPEEKGTAVTGERDSRDSTE
ncbi:hypothetical protein [Stigmatella aurantiaca]|uniref:SH3 domain-containing protein n=1 Tax=Stigmatella aurantiaca (strain DW4/3-1) TaxID=378806 RepID=Q090I8_STIAD|nr:hypothetical protein [Stigmatella aurantiaca]ADO70785.1 uncharacterized protein STAUR_2993 [Stigmatella aurantiaca DW4/3-1]EAU66151.1 hypothetical protein STIAU_4312 [Stigmatella aurantiaca DW4/3-1]